MYVSSLEDAFFFFLQRSSFVLFFSALSETVFKD